MAQLERLEFGPFRLDPVHRRLWRGRSAIALQAQPFVVLQYLVAHAGRVVPAEEILRHAWDGAHVSRTALRVCVRAIRVALDDDASAPRYVETVGRNGYRFLLGGALAPTDDETAVERRPVVGRDAVIRRLESCAAAAGRGERQLVFLTGEPGIGKTTVVDLLLERLPALGPASVARGQCLEQYGEGEAYLPVLDALGRLCRAPGGVRVIELVRRHAPTWLAQMPALVPDAHAEALQRSVAGATRERMLREMAEALEALAAERSVVLVLEDLHWSDRSTIELLSYVAQRREHARLLIVATYRPVELVMRDHALLDVKPRLESQGACIELPLELLSEVEVAHYLTKRFGQKRAAKRLAHELHRRTDGNPLFMVNLLDEGIARLGTAEGAPPDAAAIADESTLPESVQQTIGRQISRRDATARAVLEAASVCGMEFDVVAVAVALERDADAVEDACEDLVREGHFLREAGVAEWPDGSVGGRYAFRHVLYQQVLYRRIPATRRIRLHRRIAEREEAGWGARACEIAGKLAAHFTAARDLERAVRYHAAAGENEMRKSAYPEAVRQLDGGLDLLRKLPDSAARAEQELVMQVPLASALMISRGVTDGEVLQAAERALELCGKVPESPRLVAIMTGMLGLYLTRGDLRTALDLAERARSIAERVGVAALRVTAQSGLGTALLLAGQFGRARDQLEQALGMDDGQAVAGDCSTVDDRQVTAAALIAAALWFLGFPDDASQRMQGAIRRAEKVAHPFELGNIHVFAAIVYAGRRDLDEVARRADAMRRLATEHGLPMLLPSGTILEGWVLVQRGQVGRGLEQIQQGLAAYEVASGPLIRPWYLSLMADGLARAGRVADAVEVLDRALAQVERSGERWCEAELFRMRGELALSLESAGRTPAHAGGRRRARPAIGSTSASAARACFAKAIEAARGQRARSWELRAATSLARLLHRQRETEEAHRVLAEAYDPFAEGFATPDLQDARALLAELARARIAKTRAVSPTR